METSHFSYLPAELRNHIYGLALTHSDAFTIQLWTGSPNLVRTQNLQPNILAFTRVSKQFRDEAASVFYASNKFIVVTKRLGELYCGDARNHGNTKWQTGLHQWLASIKYRQYQYLPSVEIDIGTSLMSTRWPSSEDIWRSVTDVLHEFEPEKTTVFMKTEILWRQKPKRGFVVCLPLTDTSLAHQAVEETLERQRWLLRAFFHESDFRGPGTALYEKIEFETCGQELHGFVELLEQVSESGG